ncbi:MAG: hypothetical protein RIB60_06245 [Phycisphaerales bacterium]
MTDAEALAAFLAERHVPCPSCRYDLHGLRGTRCPECDLGLELRVNLEDPRLGWWLTAVVGLAVGVGFQALLLGYFVCLHFFSRFGPSVTDAAPLMVGLAVEGPALVAGLRARWWFRRRAWWARVGLAGLCWVATLASAILFFVLVR